MLVTEALTEIRNKINDRDEVGLDTSEILSYLNEAVQYISSLMIANGSPELVKEELIEEESFVLPPNFARFCGYYPVKRTGNVVELLDEPPMKVRYATTYPLLTGEEDEEMPFNHIALTQVAIKVASVYANNQEQLNVSQDTSLYQEIMQAIASSMGVGVSG